MINVKGAANPAAPSIKEREGINTMLEANINTKDRRWITTAELVAYTGLSRNKATEISRKCGALKKISTRRNLHDRFRIDAALESM